MARIAGVTLPMHKRLEVALTSIYGIGPTRAKQILATSGVSGDIRIKDLSEDDANTIRTIVEKDYRVEGELRREVLGNVKRLKEIKSYRGDRHTKRLPLRGQRTKTNSRTLRGNVRQTMGSGKRKLEKT
ncbi:MAG: 30S ribosomal protein S13 [bacterium]|nr:30S ribosomal protein S13 [bacterium]